MKKNISKLIPLVVISLTIIFFVSSIIKGNVLVHNSEKELNPKKQIDEAQAEKYSLKEIDAKTGQVRWQLTAKEGKTEHNLEAAIIKDIKAEVFKNNSIVFELEAPYAKANNATKEIYLFDQVTAKDKTRNFLLTSNQLALGMGTSIEAQKGFNLILKNIGTVEGDNAIINDDQTKIIVRDLKEAIFKDIVLSGKNVSIEKGKNGDLIQATISSGGKIILKNKNNENLAADTIKWNKSGEVEATNNVIYYSKDKTFKAGYLRLTNSGKVYAKNNVLIIHGSTQCYGNSLKYENNSTIVISGNSTANQGNKQIKADKITYNLDTDNVEAQGNVKTIVQDSEIAEK